jgi:anti-sigma-K factor RskA
MNYDRPELLERLAADYALGFLRYRARRRFERLCTTTTPALTARERWEDRLLPLALELAPIVPSSEHWSRIERVILSMTGSDAAVPPRAPSLSTKRWWVAVAASLLLVGLLIGELTHLREPTWQPVAVLTPKNAPPLWRLERSADAAKIHIRAMAPIVLSAAQSYELWVLPRGGGNPVSLGLLPRGGELIRELTAPQRRILLGALQVAVSLEPLAGSPTGQPTGPVIIVAPIAKVT